MPLLRRTAGVVSVGLLMILCATWGVAETPVAKEENAKPSSHSCGVYFAPSTIPGAGFGMFAGTDYDPGDEVTPGDLVVPYVDMPWHNGVFEDDDLGFLWTEYSWDEAGFKWMDQEGIHISAASFGIGAAPNCWLPLVNVADTTTDYDDTGLHRSRDPGAGAITPYHNRRGYATTEIPAGMELFVDYGYSYFETRPASYGPVPYEADYELGDRLMGAFHNLTENMGWSKPHSADCEHGRMCADDVLNDTAHTYRASLFDLLLSLKDTFFSPVLATLPQDVEVMEFVADHGVKYSEYQRSIKSVGWLEEHGTCMDNLREGRSTIEQAGRGAFARRHVAKDSVIAPIPLIHADRNLMWMYTATEEPHPDSSQYQPDYEQQPVHQQLLLNYCFGHRDTPLLLCPYGLNTALINHSKEETNAKIDWSGKSTRRPEWLLQHPSEWVHEMTAGLAFDLIATRDISEGEEVFIDYGDEWEQAWQEHLEQWQSPPQAEKYIPAYMLERSEKLRTTAEGSYSGETKDIFCRDEYRIFAGFDRADYHLHACRIADRYQDPETGEYRYTAEIMERIEFVDVLGQPDLCQEFFREVLFDVPRDCFFIEDAFYSRDHAQPWSFRHDIRIPDHLMPDDWIDDISEH